MIYPRVALSIALFVALAITPSVRRFAMWVGLVDNPDSHRKFHREPIALCGGIAVLVSMIVTVFLMLGVREDMATASRSSIHQAVALTVAAAAIVCLGVWDDRFTLRGRQKLAGQVLICCSLIAFGFHVPDIVMLGYTIELGIIVVPVTLGWLLLSINSVNLIDGADGLCSSVGWISCAALSVIGYTTGNVVESMLAASMAGALLGFLFFNLPPAKIFLGDAGSMLVGLFIGVLSMRVAVRGGAGLALVVPLAIMAIPLFDSSMAIIRRKLTGRSVFTVDRGHLHHQLMEKGIRNQSLVGAITLFSLVTCGGAVLSVLWKTEWLAISCVSVAIGFLVLTRAFGHAELELLSKRVWGFSKSLVSRRKPGSPSVVRVQKVRLQGSREWTIIWSTFVEFAQKHHLSKMSLDLNLPWLHEGFHASCAHSCRAEATERWSLRLPIQADGRIVGRIDVAGKFEGEVTYEVFASLTDLVIEVGPRIGYIIDNFRDAQAFKSSRDATGEDSVASDGSSFAAGPSGQQLSGALAVPTAS